jgi:hypothetical protein
VKRRRPLAPVNRFTLAVASAGAVEEAHGRFRELGKAGGTTELHDVREENGQVSFLLSDLDRNWWEVAARA